MMETEIEALLLKAKADATSRTRAPPLPKASTFLPQSEHIFPSAAGRRQAGRAPSDPRDHRAGDQSLHGTQQDAPLRHRLVAEQVRAEAQRKLKHNVAVAMRQIRHDLNERVKREVPTRTRLHSHHPHTASDGPALRRV